MMNFAQANRAETTPYLQAAYEQAQIAAMLRQQKQNELQMYGSAASELGSMAPEGSWANLGNAIMGKEAAVATPALTDAATGAVASAAPTAANSAAALTGVNTVAAPTAAGAAAGAPGVTGALGALGPMGWAALLAAGLMASRM